MRLEKTLSLSFYYVLYIDLFKKVVVSILKRYKQRKTCKYINYLMMITRQNIDRFMFCFKTLQLIRLIDM